MKPNLHSSRFGVAALIIAWLSLFPLAEGRAQSALDGFDPGANNTVYAMAVQPDGKIVVVGDFTTLGGGGTGSTPRNKIGRLNPDGSLDASFDPGANGTVDAVAVQADGKILVGGQFTTLGGGSTGNSTRLRLGRLNADGTLDPSFDPGASAGVFALAVQADGRILVAGNFTTLGGGGAGTTARNRIGRLNPDGTLDPSFDPGANLSVFALAVQADGKILVGGFFTTLAGGTRNRIGRLDANGILDMGFDPGANSSVNTLSLQADGRILVGGEFTMLGGGGTGITARSHIGRLNVDGSLDTSFDPGASSTVFALAVQTDGKILLGGIFTSLGGGGAGSTTRNRIGRLNADGTLDTGFNPGANGSVNALAVQPDGKILGGGDFSTFAPNGGAAVTRNNIARLETDGRLDRTLVSDPGSSVVATAVQPDGKILIGAGFDGMARLNPDGTLTAFNPSVIGVNAIAVQADGKILVGGEFTNVDGQPRNFIARLNPSGTLDTAFNPNANGAVNAIAVQADGKILAGGRFTTFAPNNGAPMTRFRLARLNQNGTLDSAFDPSANGDVRSVAVQTDGKILVGGEFTTLAPNNGAEVTRNHIARLNPAGTLDNAFDPNANGGSFPYIYAIAMQTDGKILAGGGFENIGGQPRKFMARLNATTGAADSFDPNASSTNGFPAVFAIAVQADGKILAGGVFTNIGGQPRNFIARLNATTGAADSFDPYANDPVYSIAVQADGKILAGGAFTAIGGWSLRHIARLSNDTAALQNLVVSQTTVTWIRGGSSPQLGRVTFESSTDNVNYTPLGNGTASGNNWTLTGLNLSTGQNIYIRARGFYSTGYGNCSGSIVESVRNAFITSSPTPTPTPTPLPTATPSPTSTPTATPAPTATPTPTPTATATPTPTPAPSASPTVLGNISTRLPVGTGDNALIGGFIITGTQPKKVIVRAIGPSLPLPGALANPTLELYDSAGRLASNDNWKETQQAEIEASTIPPTNDLESAIVAILPANGAGYTAVLRGAGDSTGIGVVETYDLDGSVDSELANISTRGLVQTGDNILIAGTIVLGESPQKVIVRAIGPSLTLPGKLEDPTLELRDGNGGLLATNDNWRTGGQEAEIIATTIPPTSELESAIVATLPANNASYTAIVRGVNNTTGIAVVEIYRLN